jgi:hypothetical protein
MTVTMKGDVAVPTVLFALISALRSNYTCHAFYLPGVNPQSFAEGEL